MVTTINRRVSLARYLLLVLALVAVPFPSTAGMASPLAQQGCVPFPANLTGIYKRLCGRFANYWNLHGGLAQQGYPLTPEVMEVNQQDGKIYTVQYFERAVFEYHPEFRGTTNEVLLSLLGASFYRSRYPNGAPGQRPNSGAGSMYFEKTEKWLGGRFLEYWRANGSLAQQGMPISDEFQEKSATDGRPYTVQYFERAVFEYHPGNARPNDVLLSLLGVSRLRTALIQPYDGYAGWICHPPQRHEHSNCRQNLGATNPSPTMPHDVAVGGPPPWATLAQPDDVILANAGNILPVRYAARSLTLGKATKLGLWPSYPCTQPESVTLLIDNPNKDKDRTVVTNPGVVVVNDGILPLEVAAGATCTQPQGTLYGVRLWPDGSVDVAVKSGAEGALVIGPAGSTKVPPTKQVHASPAGVVGLPGPIDAEFEKDFARHSDPSLPPSTPIPDPPRPPGWASSLVFNGDFENGTLASWTTPIGGGSASIATSPRRAGTYSARVTSAPKERLGSGVAGGGTCPGGNRVPVVPNAHYQLSGWVFIPESDAQPTARLLLYWYNTCSVGAPVSQSGFRFLQTTGQWLQLGSGGSVPNNATYATLNMEVVPANNAVASAYFDDIQLNVADAPVATATPTVPVVTYPLAEGFESGYGNFRSNVAGTPVPTPVPTVPPVATPRPPGWARTTNNGAGWTAHSGNWAIFAPDKDNSANQILSTISPIAIPANANSAVLDFWHRYDLGLTGYPYPAPSAGVLETSTDGGISWRDVLSTTSFIANGYNGSTGPNARSSGQMLGDNRASWIGDTGGRYTKVQVNLLPFAGRNLLFRFNLGTGGEAGYSGCCTPHIGWQIDDILVTITSRP